ncbi:MAG: tetratricopeptide repeat protein, partial [Brevinematia bacterium]
ALPTLAGTVVVVGLVGILVYFSIQKAEEESLKNKFDTAYFSYISSSRNNENLEQSFQNFISTLQEISATKKDYNIVAIANIILGDIYYNSEGRAYDTALSYYSKATNSRSEFLKVVAIFNVGQTYEAMGMFEESIKNYEIIFKNHSKSFLAPVALIKCAEVYYYLGKPDKSKEMYSLLTNKYPDSQANIIANLIDLVLQQAK